VRIAAVNVHVLEARISEPFAWSFNRTDMRASCLVEIVAEDGTTGWGECFGPARLNAAVVKAFRPLLIGADALATDRLWQAIYNGFRDQGQKGLVGRVAREDMPELMADHGQELVLGPEIQGGA